MDRISLLPSELQKELWYRTCQVTWQWDGNVYAMPLQGYLNLDDGDMEYSIPVRIPDQWQFLRDFIRLIEDRRT